MAEYTRLTTLEDAYFFLHCATSIPSPATSEAHRQRFLRGAVVTAWTTVEDGVNNQWRDKNAPGTPPTELRRRIQCLFQYLDISPPSWREFKTRRDTRNRITHPPAGDSEVILTDDETRETLEFCRTLLKCLYPDLIVWRDWLFTEPGRYSTAAAQS